MSSLKPSSEIVQILVPEARWIKEIRVNKFLIPQGKSGEWESIEEGEDPSVLICGLTPNKEIILIKIFRFPVQEFCIELPGGQLNKGETSEIGIAREFLEETGYEVKKVSELCRCFAYNGKTNKKFQIFLAEECKKVNSPNLDDVEKYTGLEVLIMTIKEIKKKIAFGDPTFDPPISHAIIAMEGMGIL